MKDEARPEDRGRLGGSGLGVAQPLDLDRTVTGLYELDFNVAYNPSCYFSPMYSCPIPPKENHLSIAVQAGERVKKPEGKLDSEAAPASSEAVPAPR